MILQFMVENRLFIAVCLMIAILGRMLQMLMKISKAEERRTDLTLDAINTVYENEKNESSCIRLTPVNPGVRTFSFQWTPDGLHHAHREFICDALSKEAAQGVFDWYFGSELKRNGITVTCSEVLY